MKKLFSLLISFVLVMSGCSSESVNADEILKANGYDGFLETEYQVLYVNSKENFTIHAFYEDDLSLYALEFFYGVIDHGATRVSIYGPNLEDSNPPIDVYEDELKRLDISEKQLIDYFKGYRNKD